MATLVTVRWSTPPPSAIDERLVVSDDGEAVLQVLRPRLVGDTVGVFSGSVDDAELRELVASGPLVELDVVVPDPRVAAVSVVADRAARRLLARALGGGEVLRAAGAGRRGAGSLTLALGVLGLGSRPVEFELDVARCAVHFTAGGSIVSSVPLPELATGFSTVDAEGLGGVRRRAEVAPAVLGAISLDLTVPDRADEVSVQVEGVWHLGPDVEPEDFGLRTEPQRI